MHARHRAFTPGAVNGTHTARTHLVRPARCGYSRPRNQLSTQTGPALRPPRDNTGAHVTRPEPHPFRPFVTWPLSALGPAVPGILAPRSHFGARVWFSVRLLGKAGRTAEAGFAAGAPRCHPTRPDKRGPGGRGPEVLPAAEPLPQRAGSGRGPASGPRPQ